MKGGHHEFERVLNSIMKTLYLISCAAKKHTSARAAQDLYCSELFKKSRDYILRTIQPGDEWYILSAKHGLLHPQTIIEPYDETLNNMGKDERRAWAIGVKSALFGKLNSGDRVIFFAGGKYREFLEAGIGEIGCKVSIPTKGLRIGEQLQWLGSRYERDGSGTK